MTYFKEENKNKILNKNKKSKVIFLILLSVYIILSLLFVIFRKQIGNNISLVILIALTSIFFSYMLVFVQLLNFHKKELELYEKANSNYSYIKGTVKDILAITTINQLPYIRILLNTDSGERQLFLYKGLNISYNINENKNLMVIGNIILGENDYEKTIN